MRSKLSQFALIFPAALFLTAVGYYLFQENQEQQAQLQEQQRQETLEMEAEAQRKAAAQNEVSGDSMAASELGEASADLDLTGSYRCEYADEQTTMSVEYDNLRMYLVIDPPVSDDQIATASPSVVAETDQSDTEESSDSSTDDGVFSQPSRALLTDTCIYRWDPQTLQGIEFCGIGEYIGIARMLSGFGAVTLETVLSSVPLSADGEQLSEADQKRLTAFVKTCEEAEIDEETFTVPADVSFTAQSQAEVDELLQQQQLYENQQELDQQFLLPSLPPELPQTEP